jgi:hypothetical protein
MTPHRPKHYFILLFSFFWYNFKKNRQARLSLGNTVRSPFRKAGADISKCGFERRESSFCGHSSYLKGVMDLTFIDS